jgi:hypothetical protein
MILGMSTAAFTLVHVIVSLVAIGTGCVVVWGMLTSRRLPFWTGIFLASTALTCLSGFLFPYYEMTPAIKIGIVTMFVLLLAAVARYGRGLATTWREIYVVCSILALYFNVFVLIVQSIEKVPALRALSPNQSGAPVVLMQLATLALFVVVTIYALKRFRNP